MAAPCRVAVSSIASHRLLVAVNGRVEIDLKNRGDPEPSGADRPA
jgi:hypothetical protein